MSLTVLLVEDDRELRATLREALQVEGYAVLPAASLADAQALLQHASAQVDLVLLDLGLPDGDGGALLAQLRSPSSSAGKPLRPTHNTPVIVISARAGVDPRIQLLDAGADDYLLKPFSLGELLARMRVALRHRGRTVQPAVTRYEHGSLVVDLAAHQVLMQGTAVHLTPTEFKLLARLVRSAGQVVTHRQLLADVWGRRIRAAHTLLAPVHGPAARQAGSRACRSAAAADRARRWAIGWWSLRPESGADACLMGRGQGLAERAFDPHPSPLPGRERGNSSSDPREERGERQLRPPKGRGATPAPSPFQGCRAGVRVESKHAPLQATLMRSLDARAGTLVVFPTTASPHGHHQDPRQQRSALHTPRQAPRAAANPLAKQGTAALTLGAIGVVYGDIGTSPLYTMKEVFAPATGVALNEANLIGAVSVILWALMLVVTLKYVLLILRADNRGEGGGLALTALGCARRARAAGAAGGACCCWACSAPRCSTATASSHRRSRCLGALEGLELVTPLAQALCAAGLGADPGGAVCGAAARHGLRGPVLRARHRAVVRHAGGHRTVYHITQQPGILAALNPMHAAAFLSDRGWHLLAAVGAIVLALTGAEALYADMGHFGRKPIQLAWAGLVLPGLALNYMGQGALLMGDPKAIENPFYRLFPQDLVLPALVLATLAAIIASQAVISGAYSMTKQAIQLGFAPRMTVRNTSAREAGQIYVPAVNWILLAGVVAAVVGFGSSSALAAAYGIAVTLTMMITTVLTFFVVRHSWKLPAPLAWGATLFFLAVDALLVAGCAVKFLDGGWFPLALGLLLFALMSTWQRGRALLMASIRRDGLELQPFIDALDPKSVNRAERTAVYAVADPGSVPQALLHNLKHNQVLHAHNVILTVNFRDVPWVGLDDRIAVQALGHGFWRVTLHFGFMNTPNVPQALALAGSHGLRFSAFDTTYFLSRETVVPTPGGGMAGWREQLFAAMSRNAGGVADYFHLPDNAVVELGTRVQI